MKKSWKFITLVASLAIGTATAQTTSASTSGTEAGTKIINIAEIVFTPEGGTTPEVVPSNPVETKVLPKPSFTITPNDEGTAGPTFPTENNALKKNVTPCEVAVFEYTLTNTGNVPNEKYALSTQTAGTPAPTDVRYYAASANTDGVAGLSTAEIAAATPITSITGVARDQKVLFYQVYTVPCTAVDTNTLGADPIGTRAPNTTNTDYEPAAPFTQPKDDDNFNTVTVTRKDNGVIGPKSDPDGNGTPTTPVYQSKDTAPVPITPGTNDTQVANATTTTPVVTFTNTIQNSGNRTDTFTITSVLKDFPAGTTVKIFTVNPDGSKGPEITKTNALAPGATQDVYVEVTFPAGSTPTDPTKTPAVELTITSQNDPTKTDKTLDYVTLPKASFGDPTPTTPGGNPTPVGTPPVGTPTEFPVGSGNPTNPILPPTTCTTPIRTYLPMEVANLGNAEDLFNVSGTAPVQLTDGTTITVNVVYYKDVNGDGKLDSGDTLLVDTNADGKPDTGALAAGVEMKLVAAVDVPCAAAKQIITLNQVVTSPKTGATAPDKNDTITIGKTPIASPVKTADKLNALPGEDITYTIIGKNTSNGTVTKAFIKDPLNANTTFKSWTATSDTAGTILYSVDGTNWLTTPLTVAQVPAGTTVYAGVDTNGNSIIDTGDLLPAGKSITAKLVVTVK